MRLPSLQTGLEMLDACGTAQDWCKGKGWRRAWELCHRADWMSWLIDEIDPFIDQRWVRMAAIWCAVEVLPLCPDSPWPRRALEYSVARCRGEYVPRPKWPFGGGLEMTNAQWHSALACEDTMGGLLEATVTHCEDACLNVHPGPEGSQRRSARCIRSVIPWNMVEEALKKRFELMASRGW